MFIYALIYFIGVVLLTLAYLITWAVGNNKLPKENVRESLASMPGAIMAIIFLWPVVVPIAVIYGKRKGNL